ncbi:MAG: efflux RND transporter periplasmic adaptor subunit [Burkholderiales bacterium]
MKKTIFKTGLLAVIATALGASGGYWYALQSSRGHTSATAMNMNNGRKVLYWYDPMKPDQHFDKPGKSPFMSMPLVPKYEGESGNGESGVRINPNMKQNLGIRLATVERARLPQQIEALANVVFDDRMVAILQARSAGFVEKVYARAPGDLIAKGAPIADLLMPEWAGAQTEYLAMLGAGDKDLAVAAKERLALLGMPDDLIAKIGRTGKTYPVVTISASRDGVIQSLDVREGMTVSAGSTLARVNGLDPVWLEAEVPEAQGSLLTVGRPMEARLAAYPGEVFKGRVIAVLPQVSSDSRTLRVRMELPNSGDKLKPGMFAQAKLGVGKSGTVLLVPSESVIRTGRRTLVILARDDGGFQPMEVETGLEAAGKTVILKGLAEGQKVVSSGQFLIDSEASLNGVLARMNAPEMQDVMLHEGTGIVESLMPDEITISHGPIPSVGWGAMTMTFALAKPEMAESIKPGDRVHFGFGQEKDRYVIRKLERMGK